MGGLRRTSVWGVVLTAMLSMTACMSLPDEGPVVPVEDQVGAQPEVGVERRAEPPQEGQSRQLIVNGFLQAMTAFPIRTDVARQFLASDAGDSWDPTNRIVTYQRRDSTRGDTVVKVDIHGAQWVDRRGAWRGLLGSGDRELRFRMVEENGEWRIGRAPDALIVPDTWFHDRYRAALVYYYDPTAGILVPEPLFVRSEQVAGSLVQALLDGPGPSIAGVVRSFVPTDLTLDLSVPVSDDGQAAITLEGEAGPPTPEAAKLMIYQFAWTLRQDPRIRTFGVTLNDQPVTMGGGTTFSVQLGSEFAPTDVRASSALFFLRDGILETGDAGSMAPVAGPLGRNAYGVEQVAVSLGVDLAATVSLGGTSLALTSVEDDSHGYQEVLSDATELLKPSWDFADRLWLVDRRDEGALVSVIDTSRDATRAVPVEIKGITGARVKEFMVSRDGTRLVAVVRGQQADTLRMARIRTTSTGRVVGATRSRNLPWEAAADPQRIRDIAWRTASSVGVLHQYTPTVAQFVAVPVDGSTVLDDDRLTQTGVARALVSSPVEDETLYIRTDDGLEDPTGAEGGDAQPLPDDVDSVQYVG